MKSIELNGEERSLLLVCLLYYEAFLLSSERPLFHDDYKTITNIIKKIKATV